MKAPPRDPAETASIFKTRSFQFLVDAVGAENIAIALESTMTRVAELMKGERFTPETAFHMETTLGLPHGFFDQPNPGLAPETIARLKSPLDFIQIGEGLDAGPAAPEPASALDVDQQSFIKDSLSEEAQMPKKAAGGSLGAVKNTRSETAGQPEPRAPRKGSAAKDRTSPRTPQQQPLTLSDSAEVENIRRANLRLLTSRNGSKVRLGVVMKMSGFNIADRLNGKKRMDSVEANRFTERLGLPIGWLDSPRTEAEIPEPVSQMLTPAPRGRAPVQQQAAPALATNDDVQGKLADGKVRARRKRPTALDALESSAPASAVITEDGETIVDSPRTDVDDFSDDVANRSSDENHEAVPVAAPALDGAMPQSLRASVAVPPGSAVLPSSSVTSLEDLQGIAPIAEALIKTLAGKARTGRLDELKALELLQQAVLL